MVFLWHVYEHCLDWVQIVDTQTLTQMLTDSKPQKQK